MIPNLTVELSIKEKRYILYVLLLHCTESLEKTFLAEASEKHPSLRRALMERFDFYNIPSRLFDHLEASDSLFLKKRDELKKLVDDHDCFIVVVVGLFMDFGYRIEKEEVKGFEKFMREMVGSDQLKWKNIRQLFESQGKKISEECKRLFNMFVIEKVKYVEEGEIVVETKQVETIQSSADNQMVENIVRDEGKLLEENHDLRQQIVELQKENHSLKEEIVKLKKQNKKNKK